MGINRQNNYAFQRIFGHETTRHILAAFLTDFLGEPVEPSELTLINTELSPETIGDKCPRLDILVRWENPRSHARIDIEMQVHSTNDNFLKRVTFYSAKGYVAESKSGDEYAQLPQMINIVVANFVNFKYPHFHGVFTMADKISGEPFCSPGEQTIHFIELPKVRKITRVADVATLTKQECWCYYLNNGKGEIMDAIMEREAMIKQAREVELYFAQNEKERWLYDAYDKAERDYKSGISAAIAKGEAQARAEMMQALAQKDQEAAKAQREAETAQREAETAQREKEAERRKSEELQRQLDELKRQAQAKPRDDNNSRGGWSR